MGEYPLSFAACLKQEECYRLILAAGANPDKMDTNGNSVIHMLVIHNKKEMLDTAYELGASTTLRNRQGLTPLSLASKLARKDLFLHILAINQSIYWKVGSIVATATPLGDLDTIQSKTGTLDTKAALNQIVFGRGENHLSLLDGVVVELLRVKWNAFIKKKFYSMFFMFLIYTLIVTCYMLAEENISKELFEIEEVKQPANTKQQNFTNIQKKSETLNTSLDIFLQPGDDDGAGLQLTVSLKFFLHCIIFLSSIAFHSEAVYENFSLGRKCFFQTLLLTPSRIIFLSRLANNF